MKNKRWFTISTLLYSVFCLKIDYKKNYQITDFFSVKKICSDQKIYIRVKCQGYDCSSSLYFGSEDYKTVNLWISNFSNIMFFETWKEMCTKKKCKRMTSLLRYFWLIPNYHFFIEMLFFCVFFFLSWNFILLFFLFW